MLWDEIRIELKQNCSKFELQIICMSDPIQKTEKGYWFNFFYFKIYFVTNFEVISHFFPKKLKLQKLFKFEQIFYSIYLKFILYNQFDKLKLLKERFLRAFLFFHLKL